MTFVRTGGSAATEMHKNSDDWLAVIAPAIALTCLLAFA